MVDFIKEGGYCITAAGEKVGPMWRDNSGTYIWNSELPDGSLRSWTADGRYSIEGACPERNLIAEWVDGQLLIGRVFYIPHDGFVGTVIGTYTTREGKEGVVMQQQGTRVVHVYGTKWLKEIGND